MSPRPAARPLSLLALAAVVAAACDDGTAIAPETTAPPAASQGTTPPPTDSATRPDTTRPGTGAIAGIRIFPRTFALVPGPRVGVSVQPVNAEGVPVLASLAGPVVLRTADARVAAAGDDGTLVGVAEGTTRLYATVGGWTDSATVTVFPAPAPLPPAARLDLPDAPLTIGAGRVLWIGARFLDAQGRPARGPGGRATWRSSNAQVAAVADTMTADSIAVAVLRGVAPGTATIHVSAGALLDSMTVHVVAAVDSTRPDSTPRPPVPPVARFDLTVQVLMPGASATPGDSARLVPAPGARVSVFRLTRDGGSSGAPDTLGVQTPAGSGIADAQGRFTLRDLPSATYRVVAEPPEGSTTVQRGESLLAPPTVTDVRLSLYLPPKR